MKSVITSVLHDVIVAELDDSSVMEQVRLKDPASLVGELKLAIAVEIQIKGGNTHYSTSAVDSPCVPDIKPNGKVS